MEDLATAERANPGGLVVDRLHAGQDRIIHPAEGLRYQCGADRTGGYTGAECDHPSAPARRHGRSRKQIARQVHDVAHIVSCAKPRDHEANDVFPVIVGQSDRPAYPGMKVLIFCQGHGNASVDRCHFYQAVRAALGQYPGHIAHIEGCVRPGGLRQILDCGRNLTAAGYEQHVGGTQSATKREGVRRNERPFPRRLAAQMVGERAP